MKQMEEIKLHLSKPQAMKLAKGGAIQIKPTMIGSGIPLKMHSAKAKKLVRKAQQGKGMRIQLSPEEIQGSGLFDILRGVGKAVLSVLPVRQIAQNVIQKAVPAIAAKLPASIAPAATQLAEQFTPALVEKAGQLAEKAGAPTGQGVRARGLRAGKGVRAAGVRATGISKPSSRKGQIVASSDQTMGSGLSGGAVKREKYTVSSSSSMFMAPSSAAMSPPADAVPPSGSFAYLFRDPKRDGSGLLPPGMRRM